MKKILKKIILGFLLALNWVFTSEKGVIVILAYHSIGSNDWEFGIEPVVFEKQIKYLHENGFTFLTVVDLYGIIKEGKLHPGKGVLITFDDGYRDVLINALPILKKYNAPAVIFVHSNRSSEPLGNSLELLTWENLSFLQNNGVAIEDHSFSHPNLKILDDNELESEFVDAGNRFEEILGRKPEFFAYPGGKFSAKVLGQLKKRGYKLAFTINRGLVTNKGDPMTLNRNTISRDTSFTEFKVRVSMANALYEKLISLIK